MIGAGAAGDTTCNGDSGGPLVVSRNGVPVEVGVVDFGDQACDMAAGFEKLSGPQLAWVASQVPAVTAGGAAARSTLVQRWGRVRPPGRRT